MTTVYITGRRWFSQYTVKVVLFICWLGILSCKGESGWYTLFVHVSVFNSSSKLNQKHGLKDVVAENPMSIQTIYVCHSYSMGPGIYGSKQTKSEGVRFAYVDINP